MIDLMLYLQTYLIRTVEEICIYEIFIEDDVFEGDKDIERDLFKYV